ncbi:DUF4880 domain-containing protein [Herbaspirillum sp. AP02]|uniref:FecR/PupR family sigma factor regulator n=1 Tax=unclassified Herbaspirillum TaxID=2624150 RepID=UPI0018C96BD8|nr:DUF4880 domain-containing protein [Herbaspirillum sp. AP02]MBG7618034.1 DUF4880 domain-containing protein [Herbaspirillum sp. AP02]
MSQPSVSSTSTAWQTAVSWVMREHELEDLDDTQRQALQQWLQADPAHLAAYREACSLWLALGFIPAPGERG